MQIRQEALGKNLQGSLLPVYMVSGGETLIIEEACTAIIAAAERQGHTERKILDVVAGFDWSELFVVAGTGSLFAEREIIDLRIPAKKFDKSVSQALCAYLDDLPSDVLLLIRTERLEARQKRTAWYKAIDRAGGIVTVWPIDGSHLPQWIAERARHLKLDIDRDVINFLANRNEGNLLALHQELEKLKLWSEDGKISLEDVQASVADSAHYDVFEVVNAALQGRAKRVVRILRTLELEGVAPLAILGAFSRQITTVLHGSKARLPREAEQSIQAARRRLSHAQLHKFAAEISLLDQQVKGMLLGNVWESLERLLLELAGSASTPGLGATQGILRRNGYPL
ncbi:MAG: DNA polymerase III subunit delta [Pseudomonadales bacterium]|nr:DNA polymerase III subunit delta [Pseudomonadales bacterium]